MTALASEGTTVFLEHRLLHDTTGNVPEAPFETPIGKAAVRRKGRDITIVATSAMNAAVRTAVHICARNGIDAEWIDIRSVKPWDRTTVVSSVQKTHRLLTVDTGHSAFGIGAEILAAISEHLGGKLKKARRIGLPDLPIPAGPAIERQYYLGIGDIIYAAAAMCGVRRLMHEAPHGQDNCPQVEYRSAF